MGEKLTAEWCEAQARAWAADARENASTGWHDDALPDQRTAEVYRLAAIALRYAQARTRVETHGGTEAGFSCDEDRLEHSMLCRELYAAHAALLAACKEATDGRA